MLVPVISCLASIPIGCLHQKVCHISTVLIYFLSHCSCWIHIGFVNPYINKRKMRVICNAMHPIILEALNIFSPLFFCDFSTMKEIPRKHDSQEYEVYLTIEN